MIFFLLFSCLFLEAAQPSYFIAIKKTEENILSTLDTYTPFLPPKGKYYADPFLFKYQGTNYLFFEDYDYKKGVISYVILGSDGAISKPRLALEMACHLSFPYLFEDQGTIYMCPETFRKQSISLYKSVNFPNQWNYYRTLVRGECFSDPILFQHNGYYWLFAAIHNDRLVIYFAKDLESQFIPHPINRKSIRGRNAGPLFSIDKKLIRPVMDCKITYGKSIFLKEIVLLTPSEFIEQEIAHIEPTWALNLEGTHTYCSRDDFTVYDGYFFIEKNEN